MVDKVVACKLQVRWEVSLFKHVGVAQGPTQAYGYWYNRTSMFWRRKGLQGPVKIAKLGLITVHIGVELPSTSIFLEPGSSAPMQAEISPV